MKNVAANEQQLREEGENVANMAAEYVGMGLTTREESIDAIREGGLAEAKRLGVDPDHATQIIDGVVKRFEQLLDSVGLNEGVEDDGLPN